MKNVDIICIIDMSGSMECIIEKARQGFNNFLNDQKRSDNKINFSLLFFDTSFYMPYKNVDIQEVEELTPETYYANGGTALLDALGFSIDNYIDELGEASGEERSKKSLFVILTDGEENSSRKYNKYLIKNMVIHMREELNTEFIYLGANQDSFLEAENLGMDKTNAFNWDATDDGITVAYANISKATAYYVENDVKDNLFQQ